MKNLFLFLLIIFSLSASAQRISGFYSGTLYNDTTKMTQQYELALSEYRGKISGYSYVTFVVHDTFYYGIRKIKAEIVGDSLVVEDDKMIINNFPESPARRVGRIITIPLKGQDSLVVLSGRWRTNRTRTYYSVPGSIDLRRSQDSTHSPLIAHLQELNLIPSSNTGAADNVTKVKVKEDKTKIKTEPAAAPVIAKIPYDQRKSNHIQTVEVASDSLVLSFYDNGVVDGDTVSVYLNGRAVIQDVRLTTAANKKTVNIAGLNELELLLVAENLGSIPPNTGLLIIRDGDKNYQVNFSADLQTNAAITIKRKRN
jgi:hypothetical protein